mgnify:CR=1 FL=1
MARNRRHNWLQNTFKDYFVPIIGWVLIIVLLYSFLTGDAANTQSSGNENLSPTTIQFESVETEAYIMDEGDKKEKITEANSLYPGETVIVTTWSVKLNTPEGNSINLNKIAELKLEEDGSYNLYSSDAWFTLRSDANISMRYANIEAPAESILSLTQNEAGSTIYVLAGSAKVTNLAWISTLLIKWQKVSISRLNAANEDVDLAGGKSSIDSYFKWSDWFIANEGHIVLNQTDVSISPESDTTGSGSTEINTWASWLYLSFDTLRDEMSIEGNTLDITGKIISTQTTTDKLTKINTEHLVEGVYFFSVIQNNTTIDVQRIIKSSHQY